MNPKELLEKLDVKVEGTLETIELMKIQIEDLEEKIRELTAINLELQNEKIAWEQGIGDILQKIDNKVANVAA